MVYGLEWDIVESEFEFQLRYYVHFQTNTIGKSMNTLTTPTHPQGMGLRVSLMLFYKDIFGTK